MNSGIEKSQESPKITIDLNDWWKQIQKKDVEDIINKKKKWKYFLVNDGWVTTIVNPAVTNYKADEVDIINNETAEIPEAVTQATTPELLKNLVLDPRYKAESALKAKERARNSDNKIFWLERDGIVTELDFSNNLDNPKIKKYPLNEYNIIKKTVEV